MRKLLFGAAIIISMYSCKSDNSMKDQVQSYLDRYNTKYRELYTASSEGLWKVNTEIKEGDSTNAKESQKADEAFAANTDSKEKIESSRKYLEHKSELTGLQ